MSLRSAEAALASAIVAAVLGGCGATIITPAAIRTADAPPEDRARAEATLRAAFVRCNEFMASPFRHALPPGAFLLDDTRGLSFTTPAGAWPIEIRCTNWGDFFTWCGLQAQEGDGGFTVGEVDPERDPVIDNSLLRDLNGFEVSSDTVANLILHETTHVVSDEGAIGFWKSWGYYLEAIFRLRVGQTHSDERRAYSTGEEYHAFIQSVGRSEKEKAWLLAGLNQHIAASTPDLCHHAPPEPAPVPPERSGR